MITTNSLPGLRPSRLGKASVRALPLVGPLLTVAIVTVAVFVLPSRPLGIDLDSSWGAVLTYAHNEHWQFGRDLVFTYGPIGFLFVPFFTPENFGPRLFANLALGVAVASGLVLLAWRTRVWWRCLLIGAFLIFSTNINSRYDVHLGTDLLFQCGLLFWGLLCFVEESRRIWAWTLVTAVLALAGSLAKLSFFFSGSLTISLVACSLAWRGLWRPALAASGLYLLGLPFAWLLSGQRLANLWPFLINGFAMSKGYSESMALEGSQQLRFRVLLIIAMSFPAIVVAALSGLARTSCTPPVDSVASTGSARAGLRRGAILGERVCFLVWLTGLLFLNWKHGFTMEERSHVEMLLSFVSILVVSLNAFPTPVALAGLCAKGAGFICVVLSFFTLQTMFFDGTLGETLARPMQSLASNCRRLCAPGAFLVERERARLVEREASALPRLREIVGRGNVDVFGCRQAYALFNGFRFRARPIFQSYAALNPSLMRMNEEFYLSDRAPEFVLFLLEPFNKFPPLEDSLVFRHLALNYAAAGEEGPFLLLKAKSQQPVKLSLLREGRGRFSEEINVAEFADSNLWIEIDLQPNWRGQLRQLLYKPAKVRLAVRREPPPAKPLTFKAPPTLLRAGFFASPVLLNNAALAEFYQRKNLTRPLTYAVEVNPGTEGWWQETFAFRIYRIENQVAAWSE